MCQTKGKKWAIMRGDDMLLELLLLCQNQLYMQIGYTYLVCCLNMLTDEFIAAIPDSQHLFQGQKIWASYMMP